MFLPKAGNIPNTDRLVEGSRDDKVVFRMELRTHDIVVVTGHCANSSMRQRQLAENGRNKLTERAVLPVPYPDGLIIGRRNDPR